MNFLFDRCIALRLARMIHAYDPDNTIHYLDDFFDKSTADVVWITKVARDDPKPAVITADKRMRRDPIERKALATSRLTLFFLKAGFHELDFHTQAVKLLTIWPQIVYEATRAVEPTAFEITPAARKIDRLCKTADLA